MNFVVLSSSRGTTFQAILDSLKDGTLEATCLGLVSDQEERGCVAKAKADGLPVKIVEKKKEESKEEYDERLDKTIRELFSPAPNPSPDGGGVLQRSGEGEDLRLIAAIGWLYLFTPEFVQKWKNRILNVHPSLLPKYPGLHAHEDVLAAKESESGMTIHIIDEGLDTGEKVVQKSCAVYPDDTPETLKSRVQELEREWYPRLLQQIHEGAVKLPS